MTRERCSKWPWVYLRCQFGTQPSERCIAFFWLQAAHDRCRLGVRLLLPHRLHLSGKDAAWIHKRLTASERRSGRRIGRWGQGNSMHKWIGLSYFLRKSQKSWLKMFTIYKIEPGKPFASYFVFFTNAVCNFLQARKFLHYVTCQLFR